MGMIVTKIPSEIVILLKPQHHYYALAGLIQNIIRH